jgi:hypothetical protein
LLSISILSLALKMLLEVVWSREFPLGWELERVDDDE